MRRLLILLLGLGLLAVPALAGDEVLSECWQGLDSAGCRYAECPLGDWAADTVRSAVGADVALLPAALLGEPLVGDGAVTETELEAAFPEDPAILVVRLPEEELRALLEDAAAPMALTPEETLDPAASAHDGFLQISGFTVTYDATAPPGQRVTELDTGPVMAALPEGLGVPGEKTGLTLRQVLRQRLTSGEEIVLPEGDRIRVIGAHQREIIDLVNPWLLAIVAVFFAMAAILRTGRKSVGDN